MGYRHRRQPAIGHRAWERRGNHPTKVAIVTHTREAALFVVLLGSRHAATAKIARPAGHVWEVACSEVTKSAEAGWLLSLL